MALFRRKYILIAVALIQVLVTISVGLVFASTPGENVIFPGVFINGLDVGRLTKTQAVYLVDLYVNEKAKNCSITFEYGNRKWVVPLNQLGVTFDIPATVEHALRIGGNRRFITGSLEMFRVRHDKPNLKLEYNIDNPMLNHALADISSEINVDARSASVFTYHNHVIIFPGIYGKKLVFPETIGNLRDYFERLLIVPNTPIMLKDTKVPPPITAEDLKPIKEQIGLGITSLTSRDSIDSKNLLLAVKMLDGILVHSGEEFSFNQVIGAKLREKGLLDNVTAKAGLTAMSGDGISQAATTLYQAVLYSGLLVTERFAHSEAPGYIATGQDAIVNFGSMDFKFKNTDKGPVYISASIKSNKVTVSLMGVKMAGQTIQIFSTDSDARDQSGKEIKKIRVYRVFYNKGIETQRELISEDAYKNSANR